MRVSLSFLLALSASQQLLLEPSHHHVSAFVQYPPFCIKSTSTHLGLIPSSKPDLVGGGDSSSSSKKGDYKDKLAALDRAIADAEEARQHILRSELKQPSIESATPVTLGDIDDQGNVVINRDNFSDNYDDGLVPIDSWQGKLLKRPPTISSSTSQRKLSLPLQGETPKQRSFTTRSRTTKTDAGTLVVTMTPQGVTSGVLFNGLFSVAWFSAIVPATLGIMSAPVMGLFMLPFWAAGGMIAKQAVVDPFVGSTLTLGEYAWSVESQYAPSKTRSGAVLKQQDGSTEDLQGARVEISVVVNDVPQYHLCLYSLKGGAATNLGLGLPAEELEKVATEINDYLDGLLLTGTNSYDSENNRSSSLLKPWETEEI